MARCISPTKTEGDLNRRARAVAKTAWPLQLLLTVVGLVATVSIRPGVLDNYKHHAIGFVIPVLVFGSLAGMMHAMLKARRQNRPSSYLLFTLSACWSARPSRFIPSCSLRAPILRSA